MTTTTVTTVSSRRKTPLRTVQVRDEPWAKFEQSTALADMNRPDAIREFIDWVNHDPQLWAKVRRTAEDRGETMRSVILGMLGDYLNLVDDAR